MPPTVIQIKVSVRAQSGLAVIAVQVGFVALLIVLGPLLGGLWLDPFVERPPTFYDFASSALCR